MMDDSHITRTPPALAAIVEETARVGFTMASEPLTGSLVAALAASKPAGRMLELGTGTGIGTAWLLSGMDAASRLDTIDSDPSVVDVARRHLGADARVTFHVGDGATFVEALAPESFDLIYADTWPGKFWHLDETLALLRPGGIYVVDDMLPQPNWPDGHAEKVDALIRDLESRAAFTSVKATWATGIMMLARRSL